METLCEHIEPWWQHKRGHREEAGGYFITYQGRNNLLTGRTDWLSEKHSNMPSSCFTPLLPGSGCKSPNKPCLGHPPPPLPRSCTELRPGADIPVYSLAVLMYLWIFQIHLRPALPPWLWTVTGTVLLTLFRSHGWGQSPARADHTQLLPTLMEQPQSHHSWYLLLQDKGLTKKSVLLPCRWAWWNFFFKE